MNPFEVGDLEPHEHESGLLFQLWVAIEIVFRVVVGITIVGLVVLSLICALVFGLPSES